MTEQIFVPLRVRRHVYSIVYLLLSLCSYALAVVVMVVYDAHALRQRVHMFIILLPSHGRSLLAIDIRLLSKMYINFNLNNNRSLSLSAIASQHTQTKPVKNYLTMDTRNRYVNIPSSL